MASGTEMKTLMCPGPPEHEFQIPKGRGRPPRFCDEHDPKKNNQTTNSGGKEVTEQVRPRPRPEPESKSEEKSSGDVKPRSRPRPAPRPIPQEKHPLDESTPGDDKATMNDRGKIERLPKLGTEDTGSRAKSEAAANRAVAVQPDDAIPRGSKGHPMARIEFSASELVPTGQYANVTIGPVRATVWIDLDRELDEDDPYFTQHEADLLVKAANELAEHIEGSVVAVQRDIVMSNLNEEQSK